MPLIPAPPAAPDKDTLALRVDRELHEQLRAYAEFLGSTKEYIVTSALRRVFRHDKDFIAWQQARDTSEPTTAAAQQRRRACAPSTTTPHGNASPRRRVVPPARTARETAARASRVRERGHRRRSWRSPRGRWCRGGRTIPILVLIACIARRSIGGCTSRTSRCCSPHRIWRRRCCGSLAYIFMTGRQRGIDAGTAAAVSRPERAATAVRRPRGAAPPLKPVPAAAPTWLTIPERGLVHGHRRHRRGGQRQDDRVPVSLCGADPRLSTSRSRATHRRLGARGEGRLLSRRAADARARTGGRRTISRSASTVRGGTTRCTTTWMPTRWRTASRRC